MSNTVNFKELNLSGYIQKALDDMGFEEATPIQSQAIPYIMEGKDVTGLAQTGTGKTFAFGIPAIENIDTKNQNVQVLVLCPTRELAIQTCEGLKQLTKFRDDIKITPVYGGQQLDRQIISLRKKPQIVVGTPGRIMDHMRRKTLKLDNISMLILDEADEMLNMGFREDLDVILEDSKSDRQTILFSATMSKGIAEIASKYQKKDSITVRISHTELVAPKIDQYYIEVSESNKADALTRLIDSMDIKLSVVFCNTKKKVDDVTVHLQASGYMVESLHGDIKQSQRDSIMKRFRNGEVDILVATDVAARGIDIDDIDVVFNYDVPNDEEYYVHRIGRTGRAGRAGEAYTFVTGREIYKLKDIQRYTKANISLKKIPTFKDVQDKKILQRLDKIKSEYLKGNISEYVEIIQNILQEEETMTSVDIAAILLKLEIEKNTKIDNNRDFASNSKSKDKGMLSEGIMSGEFKRIFVNMGKLDYFNNAKLREVLENEFNVPSDLISDIKILEKFSFVNIGKDYVDNIIGDKKELKFNNRRLSFEVSESSVSNSNKSKKRDNGNFKRRDEKRESFSKDKKPKMNRFGEFSKPKESKGNFNRRKSNKK